MDKKYIDFTDLSSYKISNNLSNLIWDIVIKWDYFAKDTVGKQFVRSIDSISANIAEGFGRFSKKDKIHFYRYSFGSLKESISWLDKSYKRKLISEKEYKELSDIMEQLPTELNTLIKYTNDKLNI